MATQQLSQAEIWDDSALVNSWNEALEEYKRYHSIAARGERVEDVVAEAENSDPSVPADTFTTNEHTGLPAWEQKEDKIPEHVDQADLGVEANINHVEQQHPTQQNDTQANIRAATMPQALMSSVQDDNLKNLMMSWYYAGYYTGLYEGKQSGTTGRQSNQTDFNDG